MTTRREGGAVSLHAVSVAFLLVVVAMVLAESAALIAMRHRATGAADLAALAASRASVAGSDGCPVARKVARENHAKLTSCRMDFDVATVTARTTSKRWWGMQWAAEIDARAAPDFYLDQP